MAQTTGDKLLKVSSCHHGGVMTPKEWEEYSGRVCPTPEADWVCIICEKPCEKVEMLVEKGY